MSPTSVVYPVYTGFWIDWSYGKILGSTLTLTRSNANLVIAFLAFFVTIITTSLWAIMCILLHMYFSTPVPQDTLYHQRQAVLRNNSSPAGTALTSIRLWHTWRKSPKTACRILPLLAITFLLVIGFAVAADFSSRVGQSTQVLLSGKNCRIFNISSVDEDITTTTVFNNWMPWQGKQLQVSALYAEQCYTSPNTSISISNCVNSPFVQQQISVSADPYAVYPFDPSLCAINTSAIILDTGLIDTHTDLGINAPPDQRVQFRRVLECSPITTQGYSDSFNVSINETFSRYYYGESPDAFGNYTYLYPSLRNNLQLADEINDTDWVNGEYTFSAFVALSYNGSYASPAAGNDTSFSFEAIPGLQQNNADIYLIFLSPNEVLFTQSTTDPWYNSSRTTLNLTFIPEQDLFAVEPASPLACLYREQWCFPGLHIEKNCTSLIGTQDLSTELLSIVPDNSTWNRIDMLRNILKNACHKIDCVLTFLGGQALTSRLTFVDSVQGPVAANQWQQDVEYWSAITLASIQQSFISTIIGNVPDIPEAVFPYRNEEEQRFCSSQKILSAVHVSFNVFGLAIISVFGLLIITMSLLLEPILHCIQKWFSLNTYSRLEWCSTDILQLQRLAHEGLGLGTWAACDETIPVTQPNTFLGVLDVSVENHPRLRAPGPFDEIEMESRTLLENHY